MNPVIEQMVKGVGGLVTLPDVFIRINQLVEDPDSTVEDIAKAINADPSFTARLLRVANSTFYSFPATVDTAARAATIIGTSQIRNLALSTSISRSFEKLPNTLVSMRNFWMHSLYCGLAARKLARMAGKCDVDAVFTAGLLHDIGELVIFNRIPEEARLALLLVQDSADELTIPEAEQEVMGFNHAEVGAELARHWKLPLMLQECIAYHHDVTKARHFPRENALVHIANILSLMAEVNTYNPDEVAQVDPLAWEITGLLADEVRQQVIEEARVEFIEAEQMFFGTGGQLNG